MSKNARKRVNIHTISIEKMKLVKENSFLYGSRGSRRISSPENAFDLVKEMFKGLDREMLVAAYLNTKNEPISVSKISIGSLNSSIVHPREVFKVSILSNAASIILFHNHPSGDIKPSKQDLEVTKRILEAGEVIGIALLDHLIVYEDKFISMKEEGYVF